MTGSRDVEKQQQQLLDSRTPLPLDLRRQSVRVVTKRSSSLKGPWRAIRLCALGIALPALLVAVPLYMRYHVYGEQVYPMAMSDMRLLDSRMSTTWCQRQLVKGNTVFNAFLLPEVPRLRQEPVHFNMSRDLWLEDDAKEYWAFYLLKGSSITVSTCVRGPGASLIVIRGHKHLHDCAYIGDDSSEELEELERAVEEAQPLEHGGQWPLKNSSEARSNEPHAMRRARPGVSFHNAQPLNSEEKLDHHKSGEAEDPEHMLGHLLGKVAQARMKAAPEVPPQPRRHHHGVRILPQTEKDKKNNSSMESNSSQSNQTSTEVFEDVLRKLQKLGHRGKDVLRKLNKEIGNVNKLNNEDAGLQALQQLVQGILKEDSEPATTRHRVKEDEMEVKRTRRHITLSQQMVDSLTEHDEDGDLALEEMEPDGFADTHKVVNETTAGDFSNSEFWSSFSSSEEALLNCAGLILNLPLTPHRNCRPESDHHELRRASLANTLTYLVPRNGYYFFVFNSENEIEKNFIHTTFHLEKVVYNVSNPKAACHNFTDQCSLALDFFSNEKVVLEVPVPNNETMWDEEFIVVSTCEPRTAIYVSCIIAVPLLIVVFAFQ